MRKSTTHARKHTHTFIFFRQTHRYAQIDMAMIGDEEEEEGGGGEEELKDEELVDFEVSDYEYEYNEDDAEVEDEVVSDPRHIRSSWDIRAEKDPSSENHHGNGDFEKTTISDNEKTMEFSGQSLEKNAIKAFHFRDGDHRESQKSAPKS